MLVMCARFALGAAYVHFACLGQWIFALKSSGHVDLWDITGSKRALIDLPSYHRKHQSQAGTSTTFFIRGDARRVNLSTFSELIVTTQTSRRRRATTSASPSRAT